MQRPRPLIAAPRPLDLDGMWPSTARLRLRAPHTALAPAAADFQVRNAAHLAPWSPPTPPDIATARVQAERLAASAAEMAAGRAAEAWLEPRDEPGRLIGRIQCSQIVLGPFRNAILGYSLDAEAQGQGLMTEALAAVRDTLFGPRWLLHRLQAAVRPENTRSLALLTRLGFEREGLAPRYLYIDGAWRDHVLTACLNPHWPPERAP